MSERRDYPSSGVTARRCREVWVVCACALARQGLMAVLRDGHPRMRVTAVLTGLESAQALAGEPCARGPDVIILWLPAEAARQRAMTCLLAAVLRAAVSLPQVIVLGEGPLYWLWLTLLREARQPGLAESLRLLDARHAVASLRAHLARPEGIPLMKMRFAAARREVVPEALTVSEQRTLEGSLSGMSMDVLGAQLGLSRKTLYAQRYSALEKLGLEPPSGDYWLWHLACLMADCRKIPAREGR